MSENKPYDALHVMFHQCVNTFCSTAMFSGVRLQQETEEDRWAIGSQNFIAR